MGETGEVAFSLPFIGFTVVVVVCTWLIVKWLNKSTNKNQKELSKQKEALNSGYLKNDQNLRQQKKKTASTQKLHTTATSKFEHPHLLATLKGHTGLLTGGDFSPSGKHFITASQVPRDESAENSEETSSFSDRSAYGDSWIGGRSVVTLSDTEDSVTSSSSGSSKMTRRQKKNKKRKKKSDEVVSNQKNENVSCKSRTGSELKSSYVPGSYLPCTPGKFSPSYYVDQIGLSSSALHSALLTLCVSVQDRILSGFPYETERGIFVYKAHGFSRVEAVLGDQTLVSEETRDMKFQLNTDNDSEEEVSGNSQNHFNPSDCADDSACYMPSYNPYKGSNDVKKCIRCKQIFSLHWNSFAVCHYHISKPQISGLGGIVVFVCCGATPMELGCQTARHHVYHQLQLGLNGPLSGYRSTTMLDREPLVMSLDCEMVFTDRGFEVARATLISVEGKILYDRFIRPEGSVYDYNTRYSGIKKEYLERALTFQQVQAQLLETISSTDILVGHSLEGDLAVLQIVHRRVIDSSLLYQVISENSRTGSPLPRRQGLKFLVKKYLGEDIQNGGEKGHNSIEDARAALNLVLFRVLELTKKERNKCSKVAPTPPVLHRLCEVMA